MMNRDCGVYKTNKRMMKERKDKMTSSFLCPLSCQYNNSHNDVTSGVLNCNIIFRLNESNSFGFTVKNCHYIVISDSHSQNTDSEYCAVEFNTKKLTESFLI